MIQSYSTITAELARRIKLVMTDVDGTINTGGTTVSSPAREAILNLEQTGITVGLVSGRSLPILESDARDTGINGPVIAENGGLAKLHVADKLIDMGYSREPALRGFSKLKSLFPDDIEGREDNEQRLVDIVIKYRSISIDELRAHLDDDIQLLDSGYIMHLMQKGITKGKTLMRLLQEKEYRTISPEEVMVFGDSLTDMSLFELFPHSILVYNPNLSTEQRQALEQVAVYRSILPHGDGFAEVASHIINLRNEMNKLGGHR